MKNLRNLTFLGLILTISSCSVPSYFSPAISANDIAYLPKPMESDSLKVKNYISGSIAGLELPYASGSLTMGMLNYSRAHTLKNLNIAYGAFGFAGETNSTNSTTTDGLASEFDNKGFIGGGLRSSIGYFERSGNTEFRILSWENALSFESGSYSRLRKKFHNSGDVDILSSNQTVLFTTGGATELIWHPKNNPNHHYAFRLFYGVTPGLKDSFGNTSYEAIKGGAFDLAFYFKLNKLYGIINSGANKGASSKLSLGYSF